jgi:hypothetical protein
MALLYRNGEALSVTRSRGKEDMQDLIEAGIAKAEEIEYQGWKTAVRISNGTVDLVVSSEVGPRILFYGFRGGENEFHEIQEHSGKGGDRIFRVYGGHRLWVSPEVARTYYPDNVPVSFQRQGIGFVLTAPPESEPPGTNLRKEIEIELAETGSRVTVTHRIRNLGRRATRMAPWALSVMAGGGKAILPLPPRAPFSSDRLLPEGVLALWCYTDLADPRWRIGTKYIQLYQDGNSASKFKEQMIGIFNPLGWGAYFRNGHLFVKKANVETGSKYPDFGCNFELYTDPHSLELETLGPLRNLKPGETAEHTEHWWLFKDIPAGEAESWIDSAILPTVQTAK